MSGSSHHKNKVSVVMSVYDKPKDVSKTIDSVLAQTGVELELVIVSDGASDEVLRVLNDVTDDRINVHYQRNQGLTVALIEGCRLASHEFIARIDAGDCMLPGRLKRQANYLAGNADAAFVSCWVKMLTDEGFELYDVRQTRSELLRGLKAADHQNFKSPVHASVMFRATAYHKVGGYRSEFYFAQDCDLWTRLVTEFDAGVIEHVLQTAVFSASGISGRNSAKQRELALLVCELNKLRGSDGLDASVLAAASNIRPSKSDDASRASQNSDFDGNYFIASVLTKTQPNAALIYWNRALSEKPFHLLARAKQAWCQLRSIAT